jgi:hypothetical protein
VSESLWAWAFGKSSVKVSLEGLGSPSRRPM